MLTIDKINLTATGYVEVRSPFLKITAMENNRQIIAEPCSALKGAVINKDCWWINPNPIYSPLDWSFGNIPDRHKENIKEQLLKRDNDISKYLESFEFSNSSETDYSEEDLREINSEYQRILKECVFRPSNFVECIENHSPFFKGKIVFSVLVIKNFIQQFYGTENGMPINWNSLILD